MGSWFYNHPQWPDYCSLLGCTKPKLRPHHHHFVKGHLTRHPCQCPDGGEPRTSKKKIYV